MLRDELEDLRMVAQKVQARMSTDDVVGRVVIKPEVLLKLIEAYERMMAADLVLKQSAREKIDEKMGGPFRW